MTNKTSNPSNQAESIVAFLRALITERISLQDSELGNDMILSDLGLTSLDAVLISGEIEDHYGIEVDPTAMFEYRTINALAGYLAGAREAR